MIHFSTIRYVSRYSLSRYDTYPDTVCHDTIHYTIRCITTKQEGYCLVSCSWAQRSVQLTSLVGSMHVFVVSAVLNISKLIETPDNAKHCSAWIFLVSLFGKSPCIRTK